jgi:segregation and condensation protein B
MTDVKNQIEALLFSSGRSMAEADIALIINVDKKEVKKGLQKLKEDYENKDASLMLVQEGGSWKLSVKEKYITMVTKIVSDTELSMTVLETLSVIAWKAPVLQSEVIRIRTNKAYEHIKELLDLDFLTKEKTGRSYKIRLTEKFFKYFDVPGTKGIKEAFSDVKIPEKKNSEKLGDLDVVDVENKESVFVEINKQIDDIASKNDELDQDELFKRSEDSESVEGEENESDDEETYNSENSKQEDSSEEVELNEEESAEPDSEVSDEEVENIKVEADESEEQNESVDEENSNKEHADEESDEDENSESDEENNKEF